MYAIPVTRALSTIAFNLRLTYRPILLTYKSCLDLRHKKEGTRPVVYLRPFHVVLSSKQIDGMRNSDISAIAFSEDTNFFAGLAFEISFLGCVYFTNLSLESHTFRADSRQFLGIFFSLGPQSQRVVAKTERADSLSAAMYESKYVFINQRILKRDATKLSTDS